MGCNMSAHQLRDPGFLDLVGQAVTAIVLVYGGFLLFEFTAKQAAGAAADLKPARPFTPPQIDRSIALVEPVVDQCEILDGLARMLQCALAGKG